jgi:hypothetical protein
MTFLSGYTERTGTGKKKFNPIKTELHQFHIRFLESADGFQGDIKPGQKSAFKDEFFKFIAVKTCHTGMAIKLECISCGESASAAFLCAGYIFHNS